ncbi:MAG: 4-hydroxyphenylpyruvate dioxygenase [Bdellovibrionales bacterium]
MRSSPILLKGLDFIEYASSEPENLQTLFKNLTFVETARHKDKEVSLFQSGDCHFVINNQKDSFAQNFSKKHQGPSVCSLGFRVNGSAQKALDWAVSQGAQKVEKDSHSHSFPAIYGVGNSLIYFVDDFSNGGHWKKSFQFHQDAPSQPIFLSIDHLTNNVPCGEMQKWCDFYQSIFGFTQRRFFDIKGLKTGLISKVMKSPCDTITIPINEPSNDEAGKNSQIQEYLDEYNGSGIQHIALETHKIISAIELLRKNDLHFLDVPNTYYDMLKQRGFTIKENVESLKKNRILVDGDEHGYLLQIFTKNVIGPIFYEVIQRHQHDGFGEGNFQALFDSIERDQIERGYIK